jgi:glucan 1,4-alpha-glucosidase
VALLAVLTAFLVLYPASSALPTPDPTSVTIAGDLQTALGCGSNWDPACAATHLTYDATDDVWQGTFNLPAGNYQYKAALNDSWNENYGLHAVNGGANIPLNLAAGGSVKFYYDHKSHWVTDNQGSTIATAVGNFQHLLGCPGDWAPDCLRSWLEDPDGDGVYTFTTSTLLAGSYEAKVAINEAWAVNYGAGGVPGGANIPFSVAADHLATTFSFDSTSHILSISVANPVGAPDGPGALSHFDLARKDCLGTAQNTTSKVWYTVAGGVLSDVYYPTVDNTNVETLQYVVSDGSTFTDLQARDMTYTVAPIDNTGGMGCEVTATAKSGKYSIVTDYVTDPGRNTLLMQLQLKVKPPPPPPHGGPPPKPPAKPSYQLYVRFDPSVNGNGGGGSGNGGADTAGVDTSTGHQILIADDTNTATNAANRTYAVPVYVALDGSFTQAESGFVGAASDGLTQLDAAHALTPTYAQAIGGNVVQTAQVALKPDGKATLALGFGTSQSDAVAAAEGSLGAPFDKTLGDYRNGWKDYDNGLDKPHTEQLPGLKPPERRQLDDEYYTSANVLKASEDKTFPGAIVASLASPWGQAVSAGDPGNTYFGSYREVFARDLYEAWTGLMADGDTTTARDATLFLFDKQQLPDGSMPRNSLVNGEAAPDTFNTQLDECAYPILMADQLGMTDPSLYANHIKPAANFIAAHGPSFGPERWEEQGGYSPSTIAAEIAGLVAAVDLAKANGDTTSAAVWLATADDWQRSIKGWTVTTNGPLSSSPYFIRLSKTGDPNAAISYNLGNGGPTLDQRQVIDAGFLELVRLGELPWNDPAVQSSLPVVDKTIMTTTPSGPGWHRYNGDGYGDGSTDGHPWAPSGQGTGHLWPVLSAERGELDLASGDSATAAQLLLGMSKFASGVGLIPEQDWEIPDLAASSFGTDPTLASIGFENGGPAGSAAPLTWAAGAFVRLAADLAAGKNVVLPQVTYQRYVASPPPAPAPLTISSPANNSAVAGSPVTVVGTTQPGNTVTVSATNTDNTFATATASAVADPGGTFSIPVHVDGGTSVITTVAVSPSGATAHDQRSVFFDFVQGTLLFDYTDPSNDDNGPGNYAYPTDSAFHPGAFDIQDFQVYDAGTNVIFRLKTRDLTPTFTSPLGAQLIDVYVHQPGASPTSTAAANSQHVNENYAIAPAGAWSRLLQVQGFGQKYVDASGNTMGTIAISANQLSRYITFTVSKSSLGGTPASGWAFTVVLTGQDGFSEDQARGWQATPQGFQFGVCATASSDPHCTFNPNLVPKAMDVLTPAGVLQSNELDYTVHQPVVLQPVVMP